MLIPENRCPTHPGVFIMEGLLRPRGITPEELATSAGIDFDELTELLLMKRPCTLVMAEQISAALGMESDFLISAQKIFDAWLKFNDLYEEEALSAN